MNFHSYEYMLLFLPVVLLLVYGLGKMKNRLYGKLVWTASSLVFCGFLNPWYAVILAALVCVNFFLACAMEACEMRPKRKKAIFVIAIVVNLLMLGYFKYTVFFFESLNAIFSTDIVFRQVILPLGISFYTLSQIATLTDVYRGEDTVAFHLRDGGVDAAFTHVDYFAAFLDYAVYATFFPRLIQGPIQRYKDFELPEGGADAQTAFAGLYSFAVGLVKKLILADTLAVFVNRGYLSVTEMSPAEAWLVMLGYSLQLYFDFSGYCDMAIGSAMLFGVRLPENFNRPYNALGVQDFWARWHMTLTDFFRRYLYFPLGGSRRGKLRTYVNILIVFLVSGLWHGAAVTFLVWGGLHGIGNVIDHILKTSKIKIPKAVLWPVTFLYVNLAWIFFRLDNVNRAWRMVKKLFSFRSAADFQIRADLADKLIIPEIRDFLDLTGLASGHAAHPGVLAVLFVSVSLLIALLIKPIRSRQIEPTVWRMVICVLLLVWGLCSITGMSTYLYAFF